MRLRTIQKASAFVLTVTMIAGPVFAQNKSTKPLETKDDPQLIGKRDINKGNLALYSIDKEVAIGRQLASEVDRGSKIVTDPFINEFVNRIGQNIVLHSDAKVPFTIKVIDSNEVNAFALPGGFLYVNRGLLEAADNEAEVAGVLAHEIAHVAARHGIEQASKGEILNWASIPLIFFGGLGGYIVQQVAGIALPLTFLKFSRGAEKEADRLGAQYMWASGYDPNALVTFFEKLQVKDKKKPGKLAKVFSTHPMTGDRIQEVQNLINRFPDKNEYQVSSSEFKNVRDRLVAQSAASSQSIGGGSEEGRPTLKRRPEENNGDASGESSDNNRPVLKRRDTSADDTGSTGTQPAESDRPVLKKRDPANDTGKEGDQPQDPSKPADPTGRPTLKKKPDSGQ
ncbi:MAG: M48 family metalloprotease [Acidobacteria bacterium]|nr:M48 family metalloprotease [Acidobacteriota bacterium]